MTFTENILTPPPTHTQTHDADTVDLGRRIRWEGRRKKEEKGERKDAKEGGGKKGSTERGKGEKGKGVREKNVME
jgi:hypothetical protein